MGNNYRMIKNLKQFYFNGQPFTILWKPQTFRNMKKLLILITALALSSTAFSQEKHGMKKGMKMDKMASAADPDQESRSSESGVLGFSHAPAGTFCVRLILARCQSYACASSDGCTRCALARSWPTI